MIIKQLAKLASALDAANLTHLADDVDRVNANLSKVAQNLGAQGFWIRNERCWANCYRKKRAEKPSMSAQDVWFECNEEYQKSVGKPNATWDKYAGVGEKQGEREQRLAKKFASEIRKIAPQKSAIGREVFRIIAEQVNGPKFVLVDYASDLMKVADRLRLVNPELGQQAFECADQLLKIAQPMGFPGPSKGLLDQIPGLGRGWSQQRNDKKIMEQIQRQIGYAQQAATRLRAQFPQDDTSITDPAIANQVNQAYQTFRTQAQGALAQLQQLSHQTYDPAAMQLLQKVMPAFNAVIQSSGRPNSGRRVYLDQFLNTIGTASSAAGAGGAGSGGAGGGGMGGGAGGAGAGGGAGSGAGGGGYGGSAGSAGMTASPAATTTSNPAASTGPVTSTPTATNGPINVNPSNMGNSSNTNTNTINMGDFGKHMADMVQSLINRGMPPEQAKRQVEKQESEKKKAAPKPAAVPAPASEAAESIPSADATPVPGADHKAIDEPIAGGTPMLPAQEPLGGGSAIHSVTDEPAPEEVAAAPAADPAAPAVEPANDAAANLDVDQEIAEKAHDGEPEEVAQAPAAQPLTPEQIKQQEDEYRASLVNSSSRAKPKIAKELKGSSVNNNQAQRTAAASTVSLFKLA